VKVNVENEMENCNTKLLETTVGRVLFNQHVPVEVVCECMLQKNHFVKLSVYPDTGKRRNEVWTR